MCDARFVRSCSPRHERALARAPPVAPRRVCLPLPSTLFCLFAQGRALPRCALEGCRDGRRRELLGPDPLEEPPVPDVRLLDPTGVYKYVTQRKTRHDFTTLRAPHRKHGYSGVNSRFMYLEQH